MRGIRMPDENVLPPGALRDLTATVHALYRAAGRPSVREIAQRILDNADLRGTASHESVRAVLHGRLTKWEVLDVVGRQLALMAHPTGNPDEVAMNLIQGWDRATEVSEGVVAAELKPLNVLSAEHPRGDVSESVALRAAPHAPINVAEESAEGFDWQDEHIDEDALPEYLLGRFPRIAPLLSGAQHGELSAEILTELLAVFLTIFDAGSDGLSRTSPATERRYESYYLDMAAHAVENESSREIRMSDFLRDLRSEIRPGEVIRRHLPTQDEDLFHFFDRRCDQEPRLAYVFQGRLDGLVGLARNQTTAHARRQGRRQSRRGKSAEDSYRQSIAARKFDDAKVAFEVLASQDAVRANDIRQQTGFVWLNDPDRDVMAGLWSCLAIGNSTRPEICDIALAPNMLSLDEAYSAVHAAVVTAPRRRISAVPAAESRRGFDPGELLRRLFSLADDQVRELAGQLISGRRRRTSPVEFRAAPVGTSSSCHVLCYSESKSLSVDTLAPVLVRRERLLAKESVDYLVVLSFSSEIDDELDEWAAGWNSRDICPFAIKLFGAAALADAAAGPETVAASLPPRLRLADGWLRYLRDPALLTFPGEEHLPLDVTYHNQLPTRFTDDNGAPLPGTAFGQVQAWLSGNRQGLVVLGDFGDGKTFFTYSLARRLCEASQAEPGRICVPLRFALRDLPATGSAQELLRRRLGDLGMHVADWQLLVNAYPTLVILDGFDEMSTDLARESMLANIKLLRTCYQLFTSSKILLTSRGRAFGLPADQERLFDRINNPEIVRLRPLERAEVRASLLGSATNAGQRRKVNRLLSLHDPIGLATKPLYHAMIRDTLPDLPQEDFTEEELYETYVSRTLHRKLEYLEDEQLQVRPADIVGNLLSILERVATELHRSNAPYLYLKDLDLRELTRGSGYGLAHVLWQIREGVDRVNEGASNEDATARIGIRSLLKGHPGGDPERWPVDFCDRSMREYFVARAIANAIVAGRVDPPALLTQARLPQEILRFVTLILRSGMDDSISRRLERWARSVNVDDEPSPLGANSLSLLYAYLGEIPGLDWSGLQLDYAQLAGADLEARSFRRSSLRHANLDNANLTDADLSDADLTGVRLEETAAVTAVAAGPGDTIYVAYADRSLRKCDIAASRVTDRVLHILQHQAERLWLTPGQRLAAVGDSALTLLDEADGGWKQLAHFRLQSRYRLPDFAAPMVLLTDETASGAGRLLWFDPTTNRGSIMNLPDARTWSVLGRRGYVAASAGDVVVHLGDIRAKWAEELVSTVALRVDSPQEALVAVGRQDGAIRLVRLSRTASEIRRTEEWTRHLHAGPVTAAAFLGADRIVTGGVDRGLCVLSTAPTDAGDNGVVIRFELTLRCHGVRVDRMRGARERNLLLRSGER
jgi:NACHT domain/Pentapeptide repeats (8 copies)